MDALSSKNDKQAFLIHGRGRAWRFRYKTSQRWKFSGVALNMCLTHGKWTVHVASKEKQQLFKWGWRGRPLPGSVRRRMDGYVTPIPFVCAQSVVPVCEHTANYSWGSRQGMSSLPAVEGPRALMGCKGRVWESLVGYPPVHAAKINFDCTQSSPCDLMS